MQHALIVEDLPDIRHWLVQTLLQAYPFIHITTAARRIEALEIVAQLPRITQAEPPLSASIARRVLQYFSMAAADRQRVFAQIEEAVKLTERETEVLQRVAKGFTLQEIADQFELSRFTINDDVKAIYRKLNVSSRAQAALEAVRRGLVKP